VTRDDPDHIIITRNIKESPKRYFEFVACVDSVVIIIFVLWLLLLLMLILCVLACFVFLVRI